MHLFMYSMTALSANMELPFKRKIYMYFIFSQRIEVSIDIFQFKIYIVILVYIYYTGVYYTNVCCVYYNEKVAYKNKYIGV
jgi:hypothetical protein